MFISTADVREGRRGGGEEAILGEEGQQRTVSRRLAESWQTENVFSHVTADYVHSRVGKEQEETGMCSSTKDGAPKNNVDLHYVPHFGASWTESRAQTVWH